MTIAILKTKNGVYETLPMTFSTMMDGILHAMRWLKENECHVVVLESTGKYWIPIYNLMENDFAMKPEARGVLLKQSRGMGTC